MTNKEIGQNLYQIAKVLELGNEKDRFRIVAYERAAQAVENYSEDIGTVYRRGGLKELEEIPGVGKSIAQKIEELIKKGKSKYLKTIEKEIPVSEIEFLRVPGIGPKLAIKIAKELKAKSVDDLEKKIKAGKADILFKEKTKANILRGIELTRKMTGRMLITDGLPIAELFVERIRKIKGVKCADFVGSLRRMKETIGDIDIVAASSDAKKLITEFNKFPEITEIITSGEAKSTVIVNDTAQVDLEIVPEEEYGSLLQHFTGSKEHNIELRTYALTQGKSVSEHGIKFQGKQHKFSDEKGVYGFLGMDLIPPELRESAGEIQAALQHQLPKLVNIEDICGDLHVHSNWSDGNLSISEIARIGEKLGYKYIAISDHTVGLGIAHGLDEKRLEERQKEIDKTQKAHPKIKILSAVEVNIAASGDLDIKDWMLEKLDIVMASVHTSFFQDRKTMTKRLMGAINHPHIDIIGHPSGRIIGQREPYDADWEEIFRACGKTGTALEISAFPNRLDLKDTMCRKAKEFDVKFAINTDSHQKTHFELMRFGIAVARRGWLTKDDIVNTLDLEKLLSWCKRF